MIQMVCIQYTDAHPLRKMENRVQCSWGSNDDQPVEV